MNETQQPAVAGPVEPTVRPLRIVGALNAWRTRRAQRKLAGLKAKLAAVRELVNLCREEVPGTLVLNMQNIPQEIAEVEELLRQLAA
jgi:hypothetical protein